MGIDMDKITVKQRAIRLLAEEINKNRLTVFLGSGCSISAGLPSWQELIQTILAKHKIKTKDINVLRLATRLEPEIGGLTFREEVVAN